MRTILAIFILTFFISCNKKEDGASVVSGSVNAEAPYLWVSKDFPKAMQISTEFSNAEAVKIEAMGDAWSSPFGGRIDFFNYTRNAEEKTAGLVNPNALDDNIFGIYRAVTWPYPNYPDALAVTQIFAFRYNRGSPSEYVAIQEADIIMNEENFDFDDPTSMWGDNYDLRTVMLHEMGHFLGLGHKARGTVRSQSVMYPSIFSSEVKRLPQSIDIGDIASKYNVSTTALSSNNAITSDPVVYEPMDEGTPVKIILELRADGICVHHEDGVEIRRHPASIK